MSKTKKDLVKNMTKEQIENHLAYWKLVNAIDDLCEKAIVKEALYGEDILSALDRVKSHWIFGILEERKEMQETRENKDMSEEEDMFPREVAKRLKKEEIIAGQSYIG